MDIENQKISDEENAESIQSNENSIYDYLKQTPSLLIAVISALVAIMTFFAKLFSFIVARKELAFWEISLAYANSATNRVTLFSAIASLLYSFSLMIASMWFRTTYDAYLPQKKLRLAIQYYMKSEKKRIKDVMRQKSSRTSSIQDSQVSESLKKLCSLCNELDREFKQMFFINLFPMCLILFFVFVLYLGISSPTMSRSIWRIAGICAIVQIVTFGVVAKIHSAKTLDKKSLKKGDLSGDTIKTLGAARRIDKFPLSKVLSAGPREILKNETIWTILFTLVLNCFLVLVLHLLLPSTPIASNKSLAITTINNQPYAIVYQTDDKIFLEAAEIQVSNATSNPVYHLTVYTNEQQILSPNAISFSIYEFESITKTHRSKGFNF